MHSLCFFFCPFEGGTVFGPLVHEICRDAVYGLARILVRREDFPLRDRVAAISSLSFRLRGHDQSSVKREEARVCTRVQGRVLTPTELLPELYSRT